MYRAIAFVFFILSLVVNLNAQPNANSTSVQLLTPEQMREDVLFFYEKIKAIHPNPYYVVCKKELDGRIQNIVDSLHTPLTQTEFWTRIAQLNTCFDAHTELVHISDFPEYRVSQKKLLPAYAISLDNGRLYFNKMASFFWPDSLVGAEIISINNIPSKRIVQDMISYWSYESLFPHNIKTLSVSVERNFPILFYYLYGKANTISLRYYDKKKNACRIFNLVDPFDRNSYYQQLETAVSKGNSTPRKQAFELRCYPKDSIAIVELNSFSTEYEDILDDSLKQYISIINEHKISNLFIDVSCNGGGSSILALKILEHLENTPDKALDFGSVDMKKSQELSDKLLGDANFFQRCGYFLLNSEARRYMSASNGKILHGESKMKIKKTSPMYKHNVFLIQSNYSFSAVIDLSSIVQYYQIGTIIGEETGGLTTCYIDPISFSLPNSKLKSRCSMKYVEGVGSIGFGRGVVPDIEYKIDHHNSFTLEELKEMLKLTGKHIYSP